MLRIRCRRFRCFSTTTSDSGRILKKKKVFQNLDFVYVWEIERRMKPFGILSWDTLSDDMIESWVSLTSKGDILSQIEQDLQESGLSGPPPLKKGEVYAFSAHVDSSGQFTPSIPLIAQSNRMFRVYGPHRFLRVHYDLPLPKHLRLHALSFAGRRWELLYAELGKGVVVYFAVKGNGINREISIERVREWHIPLLEQDGTETSNMNMTLAKFNARFSLAFSGSVGTVVFDKVTNVDDVKSDFSGLVMTDGCAAMPLWAMQQIANAANLTVLPSVVQGRLGSCKGVWYLDPAVFTPQKRPSMEKIDLPFPTVEQRRFELVEWSRDRGPASLNYQFIYVLMHLGVPMETFLSLLREYAVQLRNDLITRPRHFIYDNVLDSSATIGSFAGRALAMISAGFKPNSTPHLKRLLSIAASGKIARLGERVRVPVTHSRWLILVADPTGSLEFGQAYAHPSSLPNPLKGRVVVARNPCHLPSDVQVVECVNEPRLAHIRDALVLPVKGPYPAAQLLSGGDHDGDLAFVSWDSRLMPPAGCPERMPPPKLPEPVKTASTTTTDGSSPLGLRTVGSIIKSSNSSDRHSAITAAMVELFRGFSPTLGILTQIHAAIAEKEGVASSNAVKVGWLCREAVDAPKSSGQKVRVPKSLQSVAGLLAKDEVLSELVDECKRLKQSFEDEDSESMERDGDLVLDFTKTEAKFASAEYNSWCRSMRKAFESQNTNGSPTVLDNVKHEYRRRFLAHGTAERRLHLASAYYVCGQESSNDSFAFSVCFRELIRIKADAVEGRNEKDSIAFSIPYENLIKHFE